MKEEAILAKVYEAVGRWRRTGVRLRMKKTTLDAYASAFENPRMDEARRLPGR